MVSIASSEEMLLGDAKKLLLRELMPLVGKRNLEEAFIAWLLSDAGISFKLNDAASIVALHTGGQRHYHDVAILGFAAASNLLKDSELNALFEGLVWVSGREPLLDGYLQGFCTDVVALLGIVLGVKTLNNEMTTNQVHEWLNSFIEKSFQSRLDDWLKCLLVSVYQLGNLNFLHSIPSVDALADVRIALRAKNALNYSFPSEEDDKIAALSSIKLGFKADVPISRVALRLAAFNSIQRLIPSTSLIKPSIEDVIRVLNRIPAAFRRWTWEDKPKTRGGEARKWYIDNEYHVQNLLYFLLSPIFPDLKDEEYTPSIGQKHPRVDLSIPSLSLIIEVKFMRTGDKPQDMIEQIAADSSLYLANNLTYKQIIAFIWDDSSQSQEHDCMRNGLRELSGITEAVIMARPGNLSK